MEKKLVFQEVQDLEALCQEVSRFIWSHPELGGNEKK